MRVLVLGASGMAGHMIALYLREKGYQVETLACTRKLDEGTYLLDVTDFKRLTDFMDQHSYDAVVNGIGMLVAASEKQKEKAVLINAFLPHFLEQYYSKKKTQVIHLSTDCIFSGEKGPYRVEDIPDATSFYGRSKALGEINDEKDVTIRTSIIGPELNERGIGLFHWFMKQQGEVRGFDSVYWNGITTLEMAQVIQELLIAPKAGIYQVTIEKSISKYELLKLFQLATGKKDIQIIPCDEKKSNKVLVPSKGFEAHSRKSYEEVIGEMIWWMQQHPKLYKQYHL